MLQKKEKKSKPFSHLKIYFLSRKEKRRPKIDSNPPKELDTNSHFLPKEIVTN